MYFETYSKFRFALAWPSRSSRLYNNFQKLFFPAPRVGPGPEPGLGIRDQPRTLVARIVASGLPETDSVSVYRKPSACL